MFFIVFKITQIKNAFHSSSLKYRRISLLFLIKYFVFYRFDLDINYLHVAQAAFYCSAFFTAIFYAELWFEEKKKLDSECTNLDQICAKYPNEGATLTKLLRECYSKIGNSDGIHGCGYMHLLDTESEIQHYEHLKKWNLSMLYHDIQLSQDRKNSSSGLVTSLQKSGLYHTLSNLIRSDSSEEELSAVHYSCAAKLSDWSLLDLSYKNKDGEAAEMYEKHYYFALKSLHCEDIVTFQGEISKARKCVIAELSNCSLESTKNLYLPLSRLQCLKELEDFSATLQTADTLNLEILYSKWKQQDEMKCCEFELIESILSQRCLIIKDQLERTKTIDFKAALHSILCEMYYKLTKVAREEKHYDTAIRNFNFLNRLTNVPKFISGETKIERARISWEQGERDIGKFFLSHYLSGNGVNGELKSRALRLYGDWMAETKSENPRCIIEQYYIKSIEESKEQSNRVDSFASLAKFADWNYQQLNEYLSSPQFEMKQNLINQQQTLATELQEELARNRSRDKKVACIMARKQSDIDENEIRSVKREKESFLSLAVRYYLLTLKEGGKFDKNVFRLVSLWLSNYTNNDTAQNINDFLHTIPSYKFLCLLPQIVPRMPDIPTIYTLIGESF